MGMMRITVSSLQGNRGLGPPLGDFDPNARIIEWALNAAREVDYGCRRYAEIGIQGTPTPGGGAVGWIVLGQGVALLRMVSNLTAKSKSGNQARGLKINPGHNRGI